MGPTNSVKNIEWWQVSDGAKQVGYLKWWVMSNEWQKLNDEKYWSKQPLNLSKLNWSIDMTPQVVDGI